MLNLRNEDSKPRCQAQISTISNFKDAFTMSHYEGLLPKWIYPLLKCAQGPKIMLFIYIFGLVYWLKTRVGVSSTLRILLSAGRVKTTLKQIWKWSFIVFAEQAPRQAAVWSAVGRCSPSMLLLPSVGEAMWSGHRGDPGSDDPSVPGSTIPPLMFRSGPRTMPCFWTQTHTSLLFVHGSATMSRVATLIKTVQG